MHARFSLIAVSGLVLLAIATGAPCAWAQAGVDIFVTPIPNLPFTGVINVERSFVQRDGSIVNVKTIRDIGRDTPTHANSSIRPADPDLYDTQSPRPNFLDQNG